MVTHPGATHLYPQWRDDAMSSTPSRIDRWFDREDDSAESQRSAALNRYTKRFQTPIDTVALCTIWLTVMPFSSRSHEYYELWLAARLGLSALFAVDLAIRSRLSGKGIRYAATHPMAVASVVFPPVRVLLSLRLLRRMFSRGNLIEFLFVAIMLMLNGAIIVWAFEHNAPGATITTLGDSLWWAIVTVTTVGYGDYSPVTTIGRLVAAAMMVLGVIVLAVVTANVAASFRDQVSPGGGGLTGSPQPTTDELAARLASIEHHLQRALPVGGDGDHATSTTADDPVGSNPDQPPGAD